MKMIMKEKKMEESIDICIYLITKLGLLHRLESRH